MSGIAQQGHADGRAYIIEQWDQAHPRWNELMAFVDAQGQSKWVQFRADWHIQSYMLIALAGGLISGFLRFVTQPIGPDADCPPVTLNRRTLIEAKVMAFAVDLRVQRHGIGRALQEEAIRRAKQLRCFQLRSHSGGEHAANQQLKLSMGFGVHPIVRGDDARGAYFVLPLQVGIDPNADNT